MRTLARVTLMALLLGTGVAAVPTAAAAAPVKTLAYLDLPADATWSYVYGINNRGTVVGTVNGQPVAWDAATGRMRRLTGPNGERYGSAHGINDNGVIVGSTGPILTDPVPRATRWSATGAATYLGEKGTGATTVSTDGHVAGWKRAGSFSGLYSGRFTGGAFQHLDGLPQATGYPGSIAEGGALTGYFREGVNLTERRGFWHRADVEPQLLAPAPTGRSEGVAISANGTKIAGTADDQAAVWQYFWLFGDHWTLSVLGGSRGGVTVTTGMSRNGAILVGTSAGRGWTHEAGQFTELPGTNAKPSSVNDQGVVAGTVTLMVGNAQRSVPAVWR